MYLDIHIILYVVQFLSYESSLLAHLFVFVPIANDFQLYDHYRRQINTLCFHILDNDIDIEQGLMLIQ
jgi:hypothetical protein